MTDLTLFDQAEAEREESIERAESNADELWRSVALDAIKRTCEHRATFICDDVWEVGGLVSTREDRALGPVMQRAARLRWCQKTDRTRPSVRSHLSPKPVWESLLWPDNHETGRS